MTDDWQKIADALRTPRKRCLACDGKGYHASKTDYPDRDCTRCCGTGHEIEENDL